MLISYLFRRRFVSYNTYFWCLWAPTHTAWQGYQYKFVVSGLAL